MLGDNARGRWLLTGLLALVAAIGVLVARSRPEAIYSVGVEQALLNLSRFEGRTLRVHGLVVPGSLKRRSKTCGADFVLEQAMEVTSGRYLLDVRYDGCLFPEMLCDLSGESDGQPASEQELQVEGRLLRRDGRTTMEATQLILKCPGEYGSGMLASLCSRFRPGDHCPPCEHVASELAKAKATLPK
jgi:cytochrome c-type biogenesis protein CcmE